MNLKLNLSTRLCRRQGGQAAWAAVVLAIVAASWAARDSGALGQTPAANGTAPAAASAFVSGIDLLPGETAGTVRFPSLPDFCESGGQTNLGRLLEEPLLHEFREAQRSLARNYLDSLDQRIGLKVEDVYEIASGEVVGAWMPYPKEKRQPYALCVIADIRGRTDKAAAVLEQVDADMKAREATRQDVSQNGETIRVYTPKTKRGQLKIEQIAIWMNDQRIIASDKQALVEELIEAIRSDGRQDSLAESVTYSTIIHRTEASITADVERLRQENANDDDSGVAIGFQWYAEPFAMGRIAKEAFDVDRGGNVEILQLLQNQGFDAVQAAGGTVAIGVGDFDWLHRGVILAPPTSDGPDRYQQAARMLQFPNQPLQEIPDWIGPDIASFLRMNWKVGDAFLALETLVDEAMGSELFMGALEDIKRGEDTANVDVVNDVVPNLGEDVIMVTDNTLPATTTSERSLVAIELIDGPLIKQELAKIMEYEPDFTLIESIAGIQVWKYELTDADDDEFDDVFGDFEDFGDVESEDDEEKILTTWAVAVVPGDGAARPAYALLSSHTEMLLETADRMLAAPQRGFSEAGRVSQVLAAMKSLGADRVAADRVIRTGLSRRVKYELLRQGELRNSDSVLASVIKRIINEAEDLGGEEDPISARKLPPFEQIEKYFTAGGNFIVTTDDGWTLNGFILKD